MLAAAALFVGAASGVLTVGSALAGPPERVWLAECCAGRVPPLVRAAAAAAYGDGAGDAWPG